MDACGWGRVELGLNGSGENTKIMTTAWSYKSKGNMPLETDCHSSA